MSKKKIKKKKSLQDNVCFRNKFMTATKWLIKYFTLTMQIKLTIKQIQECQKQGMIFHRIDTCI